MIALSVNATALAHGVHYGLLVVGFAGLVALLGPQLLGRPSATRAPRDEHELRVRALSDQIASGTLGTDLPAATPAPEAPDRRASLLLPVAIVSSAAAAGVHAAVGPAHFREQLLFGLFFAGSALAQIAWSLVVVVRPTRTLLRAGVVGNLAVLALWAVTRTVGLGPLLPRPEAVGPWDVFCGLWELTTAVTCVLLLRDLTTRSGAAGRIDTWDRWQVPAQLFALGSALVLGLLTVSGAGA